MPGIDRKSEGARGREGEKGSLRQRKESEEKRRGEQEIKEGKGVRGR